MKYILFSVSIIIILYSGYILIKCFQSFGNLTEYGKGYLTGSIILLVTGLLIFSYSIKKIKSKK